MQSGPVNKMVKVKPFVHGKIMDMAEELGVTPGELVEEAVVYYLDKTRDQLMERIQERIDAMFAAVDASTTHTVLPPQRDSEEK